MQLPSKQIELATYAACLRLGYFRDPSIVAVGKEWVQQCLLLIRRNELVRISMLLGDLVLVFPEQWCDVLMNHVASCTILGPCYSRWARIVRLARWYLKSIHPFPPQVMQLEDPCDPIWKFLGRLQQIRVDLSPDPLVGERGQFRELLADYLVAQNLLASQESSSRSQPDSVSQLYLAWAYQLGLPALLTQKVILGQPDSGPLHFLARWNAFLDRVAQKYTAIDAVPIIIQAVGAMVRSKNIHAISILAHSDAADAITSYVRMI